MKFLTAMILTLAVAGCGRSYTDQQPARNEVAAPPVRQFTPKEFSSYSYGRTKAEIRDEFGSPDSVDQGGDEWHYSNSSPRLIVTDPDAGVRNSIDIIFYPPVILQLSDGPRPRDIPDEMVGTVNYY